jgi:thymidylate synthase ThyX
MVGKELDSSSWRIKLVEKLWQASKWVEIGFASLMHRLGIHKQDINRLLEPYTYVDLVLSGTEWDNFLKLRCAPDAQPAFKAIADKIKYLIENTKPSVLLPGQWHVPFGTDFHGSLPLEDTLKVAIARIARVSYSKHGRTDIELDADLKLASTLLSSGHLSPLEHVAKCVPPLLPVSRRVGIQPELREYLFYDKEADYCRWTRNYAGFYTYRHHIEDKQAINSHAN